MNTVIINTQTKEVTAFVSGDATAAMDDEALVSCNTEYETLAECQGKGNEILKANYSSLRKRSYPTDGNQLDAIWKQLDAIGNLTPEAQAELNKIKDVKSKYPKPQ